MGEWYTLHRLKWEVIQALQIFCEHVLLKHQKEIPISFLYRLHLVSFDVLYTVSTIIILFWFCSILNQAVTFEQWVL